MYLINLITNEGLRILEERGIKKILDSSFKDLDNYMLSGFPYDEKIEEYAKEHKIPNLLEKVKTDVINNQIESFIMYSGIIYDSLKDKLPKNLEENIKTAISAYYIYSDRFLKRVDYRGAYLWRDENSLNLIAGDMRGDMKIEQYDLTPEPQLNFLDYRPLIKKTGLKVVDGYYTEWIRTLSDFITFCCQIEKPVPFKDSWEKEFYNGNFEEMGYGEVAHEHIMELKHAKEEKEKSFVKVLPFTDNPKKHINPREGIYSINPIQSQGEFLSHPFIDKDDLVYLHEAKTGVEFLGGIWGNPGVRFTYKQIPNAIKGIVSCIQHNKSRCQPQDPGWIFKYFPYEKLESIKINQSNKKLKKIKINK